MGGAERADRWGGEHRGEAERADLDVRAESEGRDRGGEVRAESEGRE